MQISLYNYTGEVNRVDKSGFLFNRFLIEGTFREQTSLINPTIMVEKTLPILSNYNYMYIADFRRYYFINDVISVRNDLWEIRAHVDVLFSFSSEIKASKFIIDKTENPNDANLYLDDGSFVMDSRKYNQILNFQNGLDLNGQYILICTGGGNT